MTATERDPTSYFNCRMPMPPPTNDQHTVNQKTGRKILSKRMRKFKQDAPAIVRAHLRRQPWQDLGGPLQITMNQFYASEHSLKVSDWDGRVKMLQDVVCKALGIDDSRITLAIVEKCGVSELDAYVDVELRPRP